MELLGTKSIHTTARTGETFVMTTLAVIGLAVWLLVSTVAYAALVAASRADDYWGYDDPACYLT